MVQLVPMDLHLVDRCSIGEMHIIIKTYNIFEGSCLSCGSFYLSIGTNGTIGTNGITLLSVCLDSLALRTKKDIVFSVCWGSLALRTTNIHCICVCLGSHAYRLYGHCI